MRLVALLGALAMIAGCSHNNSGSKAEKPMRAGTVVLESKGRTVRVQVEVAETEKQRARGLMFRKKLAAHEGMLFVFDREEVQSFWMRNTYIPLDMIFISKKMSVVGVVENAAPMTETSRRVEAPSLYVLEVRGGFAKAQGITGGTRVRFELD